MPREADDFVVMRERDGDEVAIVERGPKEHRRELGRFPADARESQGLAMLNWHVERLGDEHRAVYERLLELKPELSAYQLIGIVGYIRLDSPWAFICKLTGIKEGQTEAGI